MLSLKSRSPVTFLLLFLLISFIPLYSEDADFLEKKLKATRRTERIRVLNKLSEIYLHRSALKSMKYAREAVELARELGNRKGEAEALKNLGYAEIVSSLTADSLHHLLEALAISEELQDPDLQHKATRAISFFYFNMNETENALKYSKLAMDIASKSGNEYQVAMAANNIGRGNLTLKKYYEALKYFNLTLEICKRNNYERPMVHTLFNLGDYFLMQNNYKKALSYFRDSLKISERINYNRVVIENLEFIGIVYFRLKQHDKAVQFLLRAVKKVEEVQIKVELPNIYKALSDVYKNAGNFREALKYFELYEKFQTALLQQASAQRIEGILTIKELEEKAKEKELLKKDNEIKELELKRRAIVQYFTLVILLFAIFLSAVVYYRYKEKRKSNRRLRDLNVKLDNLARIDTLTGISNRRDIMEKVQYELFRYERKRIPFSLVMCDIDNFKEVNDSYGHSVGDEVLVGVAKFFRAIIRKQDWISRWGGEEFLFFLPETDIKGAEVLAEKLRQRLGEHDFATSEGMIRITMTFGVSVYDPEHTVDQCIKRADIYMYEGKSKGKNCVVIGRDLN